MSLPWFRMYAEAVDDEKLRLLAFEDRWHFVALLCLKAMGTLDSDAPFLERRIALKLGLQLPQLDELKRRLIEVMLIDASWQPVAWEKRQFKSDHDAAERKRKQRERDSHNDVTTSDCDCHALDTEQNRTEQTEGASAPPTTKKRPSRRCPPSFEVSDDLKAWAVAECPGVNVDRETAKFRDYEFRNARSDWPATWRSWMRKAAESMPAKGATKSPYKGAI